MILEFRDEYNFLSNFYRCKVPLNCMLFPSSEHCFMSFKNESAQWKATCQDFNISPTEIKKLGRAIDLIDNWDIIRLEAMYQAVFAKFSNNPSLLAKLKQTGNEELIEGNYWNDTYWGVCIKKSPNVGENNLGKILMRVRAEL
jgi:ribA/ribD-fused uncharacterized protein